jgi:hypothetical protein
LIVKVKNNGDTLLKGQRNKCLENIPIKRSQILTIFIAKSAALTIFGYTNLENTTTRSKPGFT